MLELVAGRIKELVESEKDPVTISWRCPRYGGPIVRAYF